LDSLTHWISIRTWKSISICNARRFGWYYNL